MKKEDIHKQVRTAYGQVAARQGGCGCGTGCCGTGRTVESVSLGIGYSEEDLAQAPEGANLGLGCGNPVALASLQEGEVVLDLGSGAGFDSFLAAERVGPAGRVIGVDMTPGMLDKARENAKKSGRTNVEFRLGEIEHLPVADSSVDVILSNCVINLSTDKPQVFREAFRVLRPGGRLMVSDIVLTAPLPAPLAPSGARAPGVPPIALHDSALLYSSCVAGALVKEEYLGSIAGAGFTEITVQGETVFPLDLIVSEPELAGLLAGDERASISKSIVSIKVGARKPAGCGCGGTC